MKILATLLIGLPLLTAPLQVFAAKGGEPGPSDRAWERASDNASFKRGYDDDYYGHRKGHKKQKHRDRDDDYPYRDGRHRDYRDRDNDYPYRDGRHRTRLRATITPTQLTLVALTKASGNSSGFVTILRLARGKTGTALAIVAVHKNR